MCPVRWSRQGSAVVGEVRLTTGVAARVVVVGPRQNPKGAVLVIAGGAGDLQTQPLYEQPDFIAPQQLAEVLCMQERLFGEQKLPPPRI